MIKVGHIAAAIKKPRMRLWLFLTLSGVLLTLAGCLFTRTETGGARLVRTLQRPDYGESDGSLELELDAEQKEEHLRQHVTIRIPAREPEAEEAEKLLDEAEEYIRSYCRNYAEHDGELPSSWKEAMILCRVETTDLIDPMGQIQWDAIREPKTARLQAVITAYGRQREISVDIPLEPRSYSLEERVGQMVDRIRDNQYLQDRTLVLPMEDTDGIRYQWSAPQEGKSSMILFALLVVFILPGLIVSVIGQREKNAWKKRQKMIRHRYPDMLNKLMILIGSGMSLVRAWETLTADYERDRSLFAREEPLYEEMRLTEARFHNGVAFADALHEFADRCGTKEIRQFTAVLKTSWKRGDEHVLVHLRDLHDRSWEIRRNETRKLSEEADTKLLLPLMMMLMVVMIIVLTPAMMTMTI